MAFLRPDEKCAASRYRPVCGKRALGCVSKWKTKFFLRASEMTGRHCLVSIQSPYPAAALIAASAEAPLPTWSMLRTSRTSEYGVLQFPWMWRSPDGADLRRTKIGRPPASYAPSQVQVYRLPSAYCFPLPPTFSHRTDPS